MKDDFNKLALILEYMYNDAPRPSSPTNGSCFALVFMGPWRGNYSTYTPFDASDLEQDYFDDDNPGQDILNTYDSNIWLGKLIDPSEDIVISDSREKLVDFYKKNRKSKWHRAASAPLLSEDNYKYEDSEKEHWVIVEVKKV
jgi:hypothetical protein